MAPTFKKVAPRKQMTLDGRWTLRQSSPVDRGRAAVWAIYDGQTMADQGTWTQVRNTMQARLDREAALFPELEPFRRKAAEIHHSQRYGELPYEFHLAAVEAVLHRFSVATSARVIGAWFHDAPEDLGYTAEMLRAMGLPTESIDMIMRVTDGPGKNRKERKATSFLRTRESLDAIILKLADRISNVERSLVSNARLLEMYRGEYPGFRLQLDNGHPETAGLWRQLAILCRQ